MSENGLAFTTARRRTDPITFTLDDETFDFTPPKTAAMMLPAFDLVDNPEDPTALVGTMRAQLDWLEGGLPADQAARIEARLRDPRDDLDVTDVLEIVRKLVSKVAARPTPASSGS